MTVDIVVLAMRAIIIGVLLVSGVAKLLDREGTREAMIGFGVPVRLLPLATVALPLVEIALAVGLLFAATVIPAASLTTALFVVFTVLVGRVVLAGENMECHCFGQLSSGPISWLTVARNIALTVAAAVVWWAQAQGATHIWKHLTWPVAGVAVLLLIIIAMGWMILRLLDSQADLLVQIEELQTMIPAGRVPRPPGESSFARITEGTTVVDPAGELVPVPSLKSSRIPAMLVFISSGCRACNALMPDIAAWQQEFAGVMTITAISTGERADMSARAEAAGIERLVFREDDELAARLKVNGNPTGVLIDHDGFIRAKPMLGGVAIRRAVEELRRQAAG